MRGKVEIHVIDKTHQGLPTDRGDDYKVTKIINTTDFHIDQYLSKNDVDEQVRNGAKVVITGGK